MLIDLITSDDYSRWHRQSRAAEHRTKSIMVNLTINVGQFTFTFNSLGVIFERHGRWTLSHTSHFGWMLERRGVPVWSQAGLFMTPEGMCPAAIR